MEQKVKRKMNKLRMYTDNSEFNYEPPQMTYDKATGDVTILPKQIRKKPTIIQNHDDIDREKAALYKELGIESGDLEQVDIKIDPENLGEIMYKAQNKIDEDWEFNA